VDDQLSNARAFFKQIESLFLLYQTMCAQLEYSSWMEERQRCLRSLGYKGGDVVTDVQNIMYSLTEIMYYIPQLYITANLHIT